MNNKGFAISSIIYGILIIFIMLVLSILSLMTIRGNTLSKIKENALNNIKQVANEEVTMNTIIADFNTMNINSDASNHIEIDYTINVYSPQNYRIESEISGSNIIYKAYDGDDLVTSTTKAINTSADPLISEYTYNKSYEKVLLAPGLYKLEVWSSDKLDGAYAKGYLNLEDKAIIYIYVGGKGRNAYNGGATHIAYKNGLLSDVNSDDVIISASSQSTTSSLLEPETSTNQNEGNGKAKITSLIYFTK